MSESMVERVARAICRAGICGPKDHLDEQENANWRKFTLEARAAIEAMRVPTEAMLDTWSIGDDIGPAYRAMIDAALK